MIISATATHPSSTIAVHQFPTHQPHFHTLTASRIGLYHLQCCLQSPPPQVGREMLCTSIAVASLQCPQWAGESLPHFSLHSLADQFLRHRNVNCHTLPPHCWWSRPCSSGVGLPTTSPPPQVVLGKTTIHAHKHPITQSPNPPTTHTHTLRIQSTHFA